MDRLITLAFRMDAGTWQRHANPWSVWTRAATLPLAVALFWSRAWLGWLPVLAALPVLLAWVWLNPRVFAPPSRLDSWASRAVLGERVWVARKHRPVPRHHARAAMILSLLTASGLPFTVWGVALLAPWPTVLGLTLTLAGKFWLLDRMVWLLAETEAEARTAEAPGSYPPA